VASAKGGAAWQGRLTVQPEALEDLRSWVAEDRKVALKALNLIEAARRDPHHGEGKPEPLRHLCPDVWSRRITREDRLVYRVMTDGIDVLQMRYHY
jgi:toxin YoeB